MSNYAVLVVQSPGVSVCMCVSLREDANCGGGVSSRATVTERMGKKTNLSDALWPIR